MKRKENTLWNGNVFMWLLTPFRPCIKLLQLNSCQFTSKQLRSHWCCLFRKVIINSMSLSTLLLSLSESFLVLLWLHIGTKSILTILALFYILESSDILSIAPNPYCSNLACFWTERSKWIKKGLLFSRAPYEWPCCLIMGFWMAWIWYYLKLIHYMLKYSG